MKWIVIVVATCLPVLSGAQVFQAGQTERKLDSLTGVAKARAFYDVIAFYVRGDLQKAKTLLQQDRSFSSSEDDPMIRCYLQLSEGIFHSMTGRLDSATREFEAARTIAIEKKDDPALIIANSSLGKNHISAGQPEKGLNYLFEALRTLDTSPDHEMTLKVRVNIMWAYLELKRNEDCIRFGRESLTLLKPADEWIAAYIYNNLAVSYGELGRLDSARFFIEKGMEGSKANNDFQSLANGHFILGNIYASAEKFDLAIAEYLKARPFREKVGNPFFMISDLYTISDLYHKTKKYDKGVAAGLEGLKIATEYNMLLKFEGVYQSLARNYEGMGDFRNSSKYYNLWATSKDSVYRNATTEAIAEMREKYETEKKEQQIALQDVQLAEQRAQIQNTYLIIGGLVVITILITIILILARNRFERKQKLMRAENEVLVREAFIKATIQSQEAERKRFAQDLHDSMGQLISSLRLVLSSIDDQPTLEGKVLMVSKSDQILDEMHKEIRSVAFNLMPQTLIQEGLLPALREMARRISQSGQVQMTARGYDLPERFSELQEISLYRVVQEWTNNSIKHSHVTKIDVQLVGHDSEITLTVEDDGNGFDTQSLSRGNGNGWKNIQSRLNLVKATIDIDSTPGRKGTTLVVTVPVVVSVNR